MLCTLARNTDSSTREHSTNLIMDITDTLIERALAWVEGDIEVLEQLVNDLADAFRAKDDEADEDNIRAVCEELLVRERLPALHRAQLLIWMACTENEDDVEKMREHVEDAEYWINDVETVMVQAGLYDRRVEILQNTITDMRADIDEYDDEDDEPPPVEDTRESTGPVLPSGKPGFT